MQNILINMFTTIHIYVNNMFPVMDGGFVSNITDSITYMANLVSATDFLLPVTDLFIIIGIVASIRLVMFGVFCVNWVLRFIP